MSGRNVPVTSSFICFHYISSWIRVCVNSLLIILSEDPSLLLSWNLWVLSWNLSSVLLLWNTTYVKKTNMFAQYIFVPIFYPKGSCELLSPLSVRPSVNFSHFNQLLWSRWANLNQTLVEWSLDGPLPNLCPVIPTANQDGRQAKNRKKGGWNFNCWLLL